MTLDERARQLLADVVSRHRDELVDSATDWVVGESIDLKMKRPRAETRKLVDRVIAAYEASLLRGDPAPMAAFIDFVTSLRASSEFHISTLLRGFLSFRRAVQDILKREALDPLAAFDALAAADDAYFTASFRVADLYEEKLVGTIVERRRELEIELDEVTSKKTRELDEKLAVIQEQRAALSALSAPLLRVWDGVLVLPLIGEWSGQRGAEVLERALSTIHSTKARALLIDITGLSDVNGDVLRSLPELIRAARLLGAAGVLVGARPAVARAIVDMQGDLKGVPTFATLYEGLRAVMSGGPLERQRRARP